MNIKSRSQRQNEISTKITDKNSQHHCLKLTIINKDVLLPMSIINSHNFLF